MFYNTFQTKINLKKTKMKININLILLIAGLLFLGACGGNNNNNTADNKLGKLEIEIPDEIKDNEDVVEFIEGMAEVSDEYALMIDEILEKNADLIGKDSDDLSMLEQLALVKSTGEVAVKSAGIMEKWGIYMNKRSNLEAELSDAELQALEAVMMRFEKRMEQIEDKYSEVLNNEK